MHQQDEHHRGFFRLSSAVVVCLLLSFGSRHFTAQLHAGQAAAAAAPIPTSSTGATAAPLEQHAGHSHLAPPYAGEGAPQPQLKAGPSQTGNSFIDFFTGGGSYMPRTHCLTTPDGQTDWPWIAALVILSASVIAAYLRIFVFWMQSYFSEKSEDRNQKLFDLAAIFLLCATCGYGMSIVMFAWPGYRLLAFFLLLLNAFSWKFCAHLSPFGKVFAAGRLERQLRESLENRAQQLEKLVAIRTAEANRLAEIAKRTANAVVITDPHGRIEWINEGFTRITGYTLAEVTGRTPGSVLQGPATDPEQKRRLAEAIRNGEPVTAELINYAKDGRSYTVRIEIAPLRDEQQKLTGFMAIESDVTEARTIAENLRSERERLVSLVHNLPGVAFRVACDERWTNLFVSDAIETLTGYPASDFINNAVRDCSSITHPDDRERVDLCVQEAIRTRLAYSVEYRIVHRSGSIRWVSERGSAVFEGETPRYVDGVQFDITELRETREHARIASQAKSMFLANMSHEIRTPLTAVLGYADILRDEAIAEHAPEHRQQAIDTIRTAGSHLLAIINDILDLSKIEADRMVIENIETSLPAVVTEVVSFMRPRAACKGLSLSTVVGSALPDRIMSDPTRLRQILMNLIGNAVKFTESGSVTLSISAVNDSASDRLVIDVTDTGPGMTAEQAGNLFSAFVQADNTVTRRYGGTGLGLTISRRLAAMMGGDVKLLSTEPARGTTFRLTLPLVPAPGAVAGSTLDVFVPAPCAQAPRHDSPVTALSGRILLAEDGIDNQRLITYHLKKAGAQVDIADNGVIALEMLRRAQTAGTPYDLLLTDMQMPQMDGYTLASTLRQQASRLAIVALTANAMAEDRHRCAAAGCDDYLTKPIDKQQLISTCAHWLGRASPIVPLPAGSD